MDPKDFSDEELITTRIEIEAEMISRGLQFSVGSYGEKAAIAFYNKTPGLSKLVASQQGTKNVDANSRNGERFSIKTIQRAKKTGTIYPDIDNPDERLFEYLLIVSLDKRYQMDALYLFSWKEFVEIRAWDKRMNAWYVPISKKRLDRGKCLYRRNSFPLPD